MNPLGVYSMTLKGEITNLPLRSGYVGSGLLSAVACGDIFASPSMKQVLAAIASVPSSVGHILLITNYTGDKLHFGLAAERALAGGFASKCTVLPATDDVSIGRSRCGKVGRRGLAGNSISEFIFTCRKVEMLMMDHSYESPGWSCSQKLQLGEMCGNWESSKRSTGIYRFVTRSLSRSRSTEP